MTPEPRPDKQAALANAIQRMAAGYNTPRKPKHSTFTPNPTMEQLIRDVAAGKITPSPESRMAMGYYQSDKAKHEEAAK